jgi:hypothetical protein
MTPAILCNDYEHPLPSQALYMTSNFKYVGDEVTKTLPNGITSQASIFA